MKGKTFLFTLLVFRAWNFSINACFHNSYYVLEGAFTINMFPILWIQLEIYNVSYCASFNSGSSSESYEYLLRIHLCGFVLGSYQGINACH